MQLTILSNFVSEPIRESLDFWNSKLAFGFTLRFAAYNQVQQELLECHNLIGTTDDWIVILLQLERWQCRDEISSSAIDNELKNFCAAVTFASEKIPNQILILECPVSLSLRTMPLFENAAAYLRENLTSGARSQVVTSKEIQELYPADTYSSLFDTFLEMTAEIPYSRLGFSTLGTVVARRIYAVQQRAKKVIVVDCDNTLWGGICSEDGVDGISISSERRRFHQFLIEQVQGGRLLCLCSKNDEATVLTLLEVRRDSLLKKEHLATWKINWEPKVKNLQQISLDLGIAISDFIFIDDDELECAAVRCVFPEMLTLEMPQEECKIIGFIKNIWEFDIATRTAEDKSRQNFYKQDRERKLASQMTGMLENYLQNLNLLITTAKLLPEDLPRAAQLTMRTNQFNLNGIRRTTGDLGLLLKSKSMSGFMVSAQDRFGEYGTIGFVLMRTEGNILAVESFVLSCRILGKNIERRIVGEMVRHATAVGCTEIDFMFIDTGKNHWFKKFLDTFAIDCRNGRYTAMTAVLGGRTEC